VAAAPQGIYFLSHFALICRRPHPVSPQDIGVSRPASRHLVRLQGTMSEPKFCILLGEPNNLIVGYDSNAHVAVRTTEVFTLVGRVY
jgi:hypothetical protein